MRLFLTFALLLSAAVAAIWHIYSFGFGSLSRYLFLFDFIFNGLPVYEQSPLSFPILSCIIFFSTLGWITD